MSEKNVYLKDLHFEHKLWANELSFVKAELRIYEARLEEVVSKNSNNGLMAKVEHFQNQFIREKEVIDELLHEINKHEDALEKHAIQNTVAVEHQYFRDHGGMREQLSSFRKIYGELKDEFNSFLAETL